MCTYEILDFLFFDMYSRKMYYAEQDLSPPPSTVILLVSSSNASSIIECLLDHRDRGCFREFNASEMESLITACFAKNDKRTAVIAAVRKM